MKFVKSILAVIAGLFIGGAVNMAFINLSSSVIPLPAGVDNTTMEGLKAGIHLFEPQHFLFPFLAHAMGTLVGAIITGFIIREKNIGLITIVALVNFVGGLMIIIALPGPLWFSIVDLIFSLFSHGLVGMEIVSKSLSKKSLKDFSAVLTSFLSTNFQRKNGEKKRKQKNENISKTIDIQKACFYLLRTAFRTANHLIYFIGCWLVFPFF